ncbi:MAG: hypothetical protein ACK5LC_13480 [Coprobacillaceae bacterium]
METAVLMKIDSNGNPLWMYALPGGIDPTTGSIESKNSDFIEAYETTDGDIIAVGQSQSTRGSFFGMNRGGYDGFITTFTKNNTSYDLHSIQNIGGTDVDYMIGLTVAGDGSLVLTTQAKSTDIDYAGTTNSGSFDVSLIKTQKMVTIDKGLTEETVDVNANDFKVTYEELQTISNEELIKRANIKVLDKETNEELDVAVQINIDEVELRQIKDASEAGGIYNLTFTTSISTKTRTSLTLSKTIQVTVDKKIPSMPTTPDEPQTNTGSQISSNAQSTNTNNTIHTGDTTSITILLGILFVTGYYFIYNRRKNTVSE